MKLQLKASRVADRTCFAALPRHISDALLNQHADSLGSGGALEVTWEIVGQQDAEGGLQHTTLPSLQSGSLT